MSESLACLLTGLALLLALRFDGQPEPRSVAAALGAVVGLAALARSELALARRSGSPAWPGGDRPATPVGR